MDLNHSFTVPASVAETWRTFEDIESVAACFPGATVTEVADSDFKGTCKVKLGPIALVYSGAGTFLEKDESARRFVIEAKGKDKRGNGTAGATVTATFTEEAPDSTRVDVATDLSITGKPAQFGRGVIEDISNKLLQQFVTCLRDKVGPAETPAELSTGQADAGSVTETGPEPETALTAAASATAQTAAALQPALAASGDESSGAQDLRAPVPREPRPASTGSEDDNALDLGATVLPILARTYGPQALVVLAALVVGYRLGRLVGYRLGRR